MPSKNPWRNLSPVGFVRGLRGLAEEEICHEDHGQTQRDDGYRFAVSGERRRIVVGIFAVGRDVLFYRRVGFGRGKRFDYVFWDRLGGNVQRINVAAAGFAAVGKAHEVPLVAQRRDLRGADRRAVVEQRFAVGQVADDFAVFVVRSTANAHVVTVVRQFQRAFGELVARLVVDGGQFIRFDFARKIEVTYGSVAVFGLSENDGEVVFGKRSHGGFAVVGVENGAAIYKRVRKHGGFGSAGRGTYAVNRQKRDHYGEKREYSDFQTETHNAIVTPWGLRKNGVSGENRLILEKKVNEREIIEKIRRLERREKQLYRNNRIFRYNTGEKVHLKQLEFHKCQKRNRWVFGGNRSGKTECGAAETVWRARGIHPYRENRADVSGWVVSPTREVQREVAQRKVLYYLNPEWIADVVMVSGKSGNPDGGVIDYIAVKNVFGGISRIGFKSAEMGREKFQGASLDFVWFDEEPPEDIYEECRMRVVDRKGDIYGTMTPLKGITFLYDRIYLNDRGDDNVWHIFMEWADNPYLDPDEIKSVSAAMTREELDSRRYGRFVTAKGQVYPEFQESVHVIEPFEVPREWYDNISIDPGLHNPLSCHFYATDGDGTVYVIAEHYEAGQSVAYHARKIKEIAAGLGWHGDGKGRIGALIDSAATQRTLASSKSVAELFYDEGIAVNVRVNKDLFSGINRVKEYLKPMDNPSEPRLYIFSNCVNLIREIKGYRWGDGDAPVKRDDHALDELRYFIMSRPEPYKPKIEKSAIELDKDRLIRRLGRR